MTHERTPQPPRLARWLLTYCLPEEYRDAILGDLAEGFGERCRAGRTVGYARAWYWRQVVHTDVMRLRAEARAERAQMTGGRDMADWYWVELRQALRVFRRSPGFVVAVLLTLSVGIGGTTSIFSLVNGFLFRPISGVDDSGTLAVIRTSDYGGALGVSSYMDYQDFAERSRSFEGLAAFKPRQADASASGTPEPIGAAMVTSSYFDVLGVTPRLGRFFAPDTDRSPGEHPEAVLTDGLWSRWFGESASALGSDIVLNGMSFTVIGVAPPGFRGTSLLEVPEIFVPMTMQAHLMPGSGYLLDRRGWGGVSIVGRLAEGVSHEAAGLEIASIGAQLATEHPDTNGSRTFAVLGFREAAVPGGVRASVVQLSVLLMSIVATLLLVVCLNVANLFLARSLKRRREMAVRLAMGAGRSRVTAQLVLEFMTIALIAGVLGAFVARSVAGTVASLPLGILLDVSLDGRTLAFAAGLAVLCGLVCAAVPALTMSGTDPITAATPSTSLRPRRQRWPSRLLIVSQVTLSVVLLFTTGLFVRTFTNLSSVDPGFNADNLLTARFDPSLQGYDTDRVGDFYQRLVEASMSLTGVEAVALADGLPAAGNFGSDGWFLQNAEDGEQSSSFFFSAVSSNFFEMMRIPVMDGRSFSDRDTPNQPPAIIVNEAGARLIESRTGRPAVGARMSILGPEGPFLEVVGVVGDSRTGRVLRAPPFVYGAQPQVLSMGFGGSRMVVLLKTSLPPESLAPDLRRVAAEVDPNVSAANVVTLERFLDDLLVTDRLTVVALGVSSGLALLLVAIGIYGLLAYLVAQRTREFGVRLALGADAAKLKAIVLREAAGLAGAGLLLGVAGSLIVARLTSTFLVGVTSSDPLSMSLGATTVVLVALAAAYVPARRAMRSDPMVAMRVD